MSEKNFSSYKISLLVSDVDGTLVNPDKELTPRTIAAVKALDDAGIAFAITSGRPPRGMEMLIKPLALRTPIAGFNGGIFVKPDMTVIDEHVLTPEAAKRAVDLIRRQGMDVWVFSGRNWLIRDQTAAHVAREHSTLRFPPTIVRDFGNALDNAVKIVGVSDDLDLMARCEKDVQAALGREASVSRSQSYYLDVTHPGANKGMVVTTLSTLLSVPNAEIATIGDMPNDVLMFRNSGVSIAMGNASADVQRQARYVTASNRDDGFAKAVERFVLGAAASSVIV